MTPFIFASTLLSGCNFFGEWADYDELKDKLNDQNSETTDCDDSSTYQTYYLDADGDGFGDASQSRYECYDPSTETSTYVTKSDLFDCDDNNAGINPDAQEVCNDKDDDCDDLTDAADDNCTDRVTVYTDYDDDGFYAVPPIWYCMTGEDDSVTTTGPEESEVDCDDEDPATYPGAEPVCDDEKINDCNQSEAEYCDDVEASIDFDSPVAFATGATAGAERGAKLDVYDYDGDGVPDVAVGEPGAKKVRMNFGINGESVYKSDLDESDIGDSFATIQADNFDALVDKFHVTDMNYDPQFCVAQMYDGENSLIGCDPIPLVRGETFVIGGEGVNDTETLMALYEYTGSVVLESAYSSGRTPLPALYIGAPSAATVALIEIEPGQYDLMSSLDLMSSTEEGSQFGATLSSDTDLDGDGLDDLIVGDPGLGKVKIFPSGDGLDYDNARLTIDESAAASGFGTAVAGIGDIDGDGYGDLAVANPVADNDALIPNHFGAGRVDVVSHPTAWTGTHTLSEIPHASIYGGEDDEHFGMRLGAVSDLNIDGNNELIVGSESPHGVDGSLAMSGGCYAYFNVPTSGVYSADDAELILWAPQGGMQFCKSFAGGKDINGDGPADLLIGAPGAFDDAGAVFSVTAASY